MPLSEADNPVEVLVNVTPPSVPPPVHHVAWGVYAPGAPGDMSVISAISHSVGKVPAVVMWYSHWAGPYSAYPFVVQGIANVVGTGALPMLTWMSSDPSAGAESVPGPDDPLTDAAIAAGSEDAMLRSFAAGVRTSNHVVFIRLDQEMNGGWYPWDAGVDGNTPQAFVAMWRHIHDLFRDEGATNVRWVWSPNVECGGCTPYRDLYPGDAYVDWIGLDGYNYAATNGGSWLSFDQVYRQSYADLLKITDKPMMISELGSVDGGTGAQSKPGWITDALHALVTGYPAVRAFVWFDQDNGAGQDFRFDGTSASLAAFRAGLASPVFTSTLQP